MSETRIKLEGERVTVVVKVLDYGCPMLELEDGTEWYIFESREDAGEKAREYWEDLAQNDPAEFTCIVGEGTLVSWGLGHAAGPGWSQVCSLNEWLDLWLDAPEEHFARYDGHEKSVLRAGKVAEELGFDPDRMGEWVAYRHN